MATQQTEQHQIDLVGEDWHYVGDPGEPAFENSWGNYGGLYALVAFYKDPSGVVHLKGLAAGGTLDTAIFTLPEGYRPMSVLHIAVESGDGSQSTRIKIFRDGSIQHGVGNSNHHVSLSSVSFEAAS